MDEETRKSLLEDAKKLVGLLEDPHPGLFTWGEFFYRTCASLEDKLAKIIKKVDS